MGRPKESPVGPSTGQAEDGDEGRNLCPHKEAWSHCTPIRRVVQCQDYDQGQPRDLWPPHQPQSRERPKAKPGSQVSRSGSARHKTGNKQEKVEGLSWNASSEWRHGGPREVPHTFLPHSSFSAGSLKVMRLHHSRAGCKPSPVAEVTALSLAHSLRGTGNQGRLELYFSSEW